MYQTICSAFCETSSYDDVRVVDDLERFADGSFAPPRPAPDCSDTTLRYLRQKRLSITADFFLSMLKSFDGSYRPFIRGLPADARVVRVKTDWDGNAARGVGVDTIDLVLESESFPRVWEGDEIPQIQPGEIVFERLAPAAQ